MTIHDNSLNTYVFSDALKNRNGSLSGAEEWNRMHIRRAGRPFCCGEKSKNSICGGYVDGNIKMTLQVKTAGGLEMSI